MNRQSLALCGVSALAIVAFAAGPALAQAQPQAESAAARGRDVQASSSATIQELIVTAQKREESINDVGMSIQAESGDRLTALGVKDTSDLQKIVPGFQSTPTYYGTYVYTIQTSPTNLVQYPMNNGDTGQLGTGTALGLSFTPSTIGVAACALQVSSTRRRHGSSKPGTVWLLASSWRVSYT